jgi:hypothetical protein
MAVEVASSWHQWAALLLRLMEQIRRDIARQLAVAPRAATKSRLHQHLSRLESRAPRSSKLQTLDPAFPHHRPKKWLRLAKQMRRDVARQLPATPRAAMKTRPLGIQQY